MLKETHVKGLLNKHLCLLSSGEIDKLFQELDFKNDNILDRGELARYLGNMQEPNCPADVNRILKACNCEEKGFISGADFKAYISAKYSMYKSSFDQYDINGDGFITLENAEKMAHDFLPAAGPGELKDISEHLSRIKAHGIERINLEEFMQYFVIYPHRHLSEHFHFLGSLAFNEAVDTDDLNDSEITTPVWVTLIAGTMAGVLSRTTTAPLDRVKTLRQMNIGGELSIVGAFRIIIRKDGFSALWRGNGTNCVKVVPQTVFRFATYDISKAYVCANQAEPTFVERLICGGLAGLTSQTLIYPLEPVKTRLAICPTGTYDGMFDCIFKIYRHEGWRALFKGLSPALLGIVPYSAVDLGLFHFSKDVYVQTRDVEPSALALLGCGSFSGLIAQTLTYPLNVIRTRLQAQGMPGTISGQAAKIEYTGMIDCGVKILTHEGAMGFYKGIIPNYLKAIPAGAIGFVAFEKTKSFIQKSFL